VGDDNARTLNLALFLGHPILLFMVPCPLRSIAGERQEICQDLITSADGDPISLHIIIIGMKCGISCVIDKCSISCLDGNQKTFLQKMKCHLDQA